MNSIQHLPREEQIVPVARWHKAMRRTFKGIYPANQRLANLKRFAEKEGTDARSR